MTLKLKRSYLFHLLANGIAVTIIDCKVFVILYGFRSCRLGACRIIRQPQSELKNYQRIILYYCKLPAISYHPIIHSRNCYIFAQLLCIVIVSFIPFQTYFHALYGHYRWCIIRLHCKDKLILFHSYFYLNQGQGWRNTPTHRTYY